MTEEFKRAMDTLDKALADRHQSGNPVPNVTPVPCAHCGHLFNLPTGTSRNVKAICTDGFTKTVKVYFCSMHIPAWDFAEADQDRGSTEIGRLKNFRKTFAVDSQGRIRKVK